MIERKISKKGLNYARRIDISDKLGRKIKIKLRSTNNNRYGMQINPNQ